MLVSRNWLQELIAGPLPEAAAIAGVLTSRGLTVDAVRTTADDAVFDVDVPANRPDALGHLGVAREAAAGLALAIRPRPGPVAGAGAPIDPDIAVRIDAPDLCARYTARLVRGVAVGPSPEWVVRRLEGCGLRSINNVVDVSNLVMLETGHPNHTFDLALVRGRTIVVRRARSGEILTTLDGVERRLDEGMLVIADAEGPAAVAGIMGGSASQIRPTTRDVLIEAAWFLPRAVRATARKLGISTDASQRFERGADPEGPLAAQELCVRWLAEICGGTPASGLIDVHPRPAPRRTLSLRTDRVGLLLGYTPTVAEIDGALSACGLAPRDLGGGTVEVAVPTWRVDIEKEPDLVEEIARHLGYDRIPEAPPATAPSGAAPAAGVLAEERARDLFEGRGFHEAFNYAMLGPAEDDPFVASGAPAPAVLANPLAETLSRLRRSVLPGLVRAAALNLRRGVADVRLFEVGRVFLPRDAGAFPVEPLRAAFAWSGAAEPRHWTSDSRPVDLWDAVGLTEAVIRAFRPKAVVHAEADARAGFRSGCGVALRSEAGTLGWCGVLEAGLARALDAPGPIWAGEIDLDLVAALPDPPPRYLPLPRVPGSARDLAIVVSPELSTARLLAEFAVVPSPAPVAFEVVDRYAGPPLEPGESSLTVRVILQPLERTLTDAETESYRARLIEALERTPGARLRG